MEFDLGAIGWDPTDASSVRRVFWREHRPFRVIGMCHLPLGKHLAVKHGVSVRGSRQVSTMFVETKEQECNKAMDLQSREAE